MYDVFSLKGWCTHTKQSSNEQMNVSYFLKVPGSDGLAAVFHEPKNRAGPNSDYFKEIELGEFGQILFMESRLH